MWQHNEIDKSTAGSPNNWEQPWHCTETLKTLAAVNEQCLEMLTEQALLRASTGFSHQRLTPVNWRIVDRPLAKPGLPRWASDRALAAGPSPYRLW